MPKSFLALSLNEMPASPVDFSTFPGGEVYLKEIHFPPTVYVDRATIWAVILDSDGFFALAQLKDYLDRNHIGRPRHVTLKLPYLPYARQDRVKPGVVANQSLSLKVFCNMLNSLNFDEVILTDPHSTVGPALVNNAQVITRAQIVGHRFRYGQSFKRFNPKTAVLVSPDAGALQATLDIAQALKVENPVLIGSKQRDMATGNITGTALLSTQDTPPKSHYFVFDDICDGGRTFTELAKAIRHRDPKAASINLYVTHGLFSKGKEELELHFDEIIAELDYTDVSKIRYA